MSVRTISIGGHNPWSGNVSNYKNIDPMSEYYFKQGQKNHKKAEKVIQLPIKLAKEVKLEFQNAAKIMYENSIDENPTAKAMFSYATLLRQTGNTKEFQKYFRKAWKLYDLEEEQFLKDVYPETHESLLEEEAREKYFKNEEMKILQQEYKLFLQN